MTEPAKREPVLVSACLLGAHTRYYGAGKPNRELLAELAGRCIVPVCPEQLGGLPTPRAPACFHGGAGAEVLDGSATLVNTEGRDVTEEYIRGAREVLLIARVVGARQALLKSRSPACGKGSVYIEDVLQPGNGVCAELLHREGIDVREID